MQQIPASCLISNGSNSHTISVPGRTVSRTTGPNSRYLSKPTMTNYVSFKILTYTYYKKLLLRCQTNGNYVHIAHMWNGQLIKGYLHPCPVETVARVPPGNVVGHRAEERVGPWSWHRRERVRHLDSGSWIIILTLSTQSLELKSLWGTGELCNDLTEYRGTRSSFRLRLRFVYRVSVIIVLIHPVI